MDTFTRASLITIRVAAVVVIVATVCALWNFMLWLPWQIDCGLAGASALAFAYTFEREETE
jgi:hypothetical protein